jgi:hypothetical protein
MPERVELDWTELGKQQLRKLARRLQPFEERSIESRGGKRSLRILLPYLRLKFALAFHASQLILRRMTFAEELAFIVLLASEARKLGLGETR